ncbi:MAG: DinB family protein [Candidatus Acidiferrum sp.]
MPTKLDSLLAQLTKAQFEFLCAADAVAAFAWKTRPTAERWSAAEVVAHLTLVERAVIEKADHVSQKSPKRIPLLKKIHLPMALVEMRLVRRRSPLPLDAGLLRGKEEMLAELREARERTRAFLEETRDRDLSGYWWPHPALGMLSLHGWIRFIAAHEVRHAKQMSEIVANLPKIVEGLQK